MTDDSLIRVEIACRDVDEAGLIAQALLEGKLAACVQSHPVLSRYHWQGDMQADDEILLIVKSRARLFDAICETVTSHHSYDIPEITACNMDYVLPAYADWVRRECGA